MIPNLKLAHALSFFDDKLHLCELMLTTNDNYESRIIRSYDFTIKQWIESSFSFVNEP
jgi:hypothetical protein